MGAERGRGCGQGGAGTRLAGTGRPWEPVQAASGKLKFEDVSSERQKKSDKNAKNKRKERQKAKQKAKNMQKQCAESVGG